MVDRLNRDTQIFHEWYTTLRDLYPEQMGFDLEIFLINLNCIVFKSDIRSNR